MRTALLLWACLAWAGASHAQASLEISNPQWEWLGTRPGTIERATLTIEPKGIYIDVGLFLTLSAAGAGFSPNDSLEIILDFGLPEEALVYDSWLWVDDVIVKADILDRRTATTIYEGFVNRRQDPSILFKQAAGRYQLRVYPLEGNGSRRVKISYLLPADWSAERVRAELPMEILKASAVPLDSLEIRVWASAEWGQPTIPELPGVAFQWAQTTGQDTFRLAQLTAANLKGSLSLALDAPLDGGIYLNRHDSLKIYELVVIPELLLSLPAGPGRYLHALIDYKLLYTNNFTKADLLDGLRDELLARLTPHDTLMVWASRPGAEGLFPLLPMPIPGDADAIRAAFSSLVPAQAIADNGNLGWALDDLLHVIADHGSPAAVVLISNSQDEGEPSSVESHIRVLRANPGFNLADFHIIDYQNANLIQWWDWFGLPAPWRGNELFFSDFARLSGGSYLRAGQYRYKLQKALEATDRLRGAVELYTTLESGICYSRFLLGGAAVDVPLRRPLRQVGKYLGSFPLEVDYAAVVQGQLQLAAVAVEEADTYRSDSLAAKSWAGNYILSLENSAQGGVNIETVVEESIDHRVLSLYTAFLCLEPSVGGEPCIECIDPADAPPIIIQSEEQAVEPTLSARAFPNPFGEQLTLAIHSPDGAALSRLRIAVYDSMGRLLALIAAEALPAPDGELFIHWDGRGRDGQPLPPGVYFVVVETAQGRVHLKVVKG